MIGPSLAVKAAGIMSCAVKSTFVIVCVRVGIPTPMTRGSKLYPSLLCLSKILVHVSASVFFFVTFMTFMTSQKLAMTLQKKIKCQ